MPHFYCPPFGTPLYWRDEVTGRLPAAVSHYFEFCCTADPDHFARLEGVAPLTEGELKLVCDYAVYFIQAPCWEHSLVDEAMLAGLAELRQRAKMLASVESVRRWNEECMELVIDPF